jgi:hypothetical protein
MKLVGAIPRSCLQRWQGRHRGTTPTEKLSLRATPLSLRLYRCGLNRSFNDFANLVEINDLLCHLAAADLRLAMHMRRKQPEANDLGWNISQNRQF